MTNDTVTVRYGKTTSYCCEAFMNLSIVGRASVVFRFCDKCKDDPRVVEACAERDEHAMVAYVGMLRCTEASVFPIDKGCGAGEVTCFECGGDGDWTKFMPEHGPQKCVPGKGTGRVLISI